MEDSVRTLLGVRRLHKRYGGVVALQDVSVEVRPAEIHALVGENGAGKSTLVKIMTGAEVPDAGEVLILGETVAALTPEKSRERGVGAVYQEPSLVPELTVLENMFLGRELRRHVGLLERRAMRTKAREALHRVGAAVRLDREVSALTVAERQLVEIARALVFDVRVLIFDEPSAILSGPGLERVFTVIQELRASGLGILYISHRLEEVFRLADRATVLKDGHLVASRSVEGLTGDELIRLMVGRDIGARPPRKPPGERVVLDVKELQLRPDSEPVSFELHAGEVLGVAGLVGSSRSRLASAIGGVRPARAGVVLRDGRPVRLKRPRDALRAGIVLIPEDRKGEGLILAHSVRENIALTHLGELSTSGLVRTPRPEVAILDEPTRGVDVGAKFEIYRLIDELVESGAGVLLISSDLPEVIAMSDRIIVMTAGQIAGTLEPHEFAEEQILRLAVLGAQRESAPSNGGAQARLATREGA